MLEYKRQIGILISPRRCKVDQLSVALVIRGSPEIDSLLPPYIHPRSTAFLQLRI